MKFYLTTKPLNTVQGDTLVVFVGETKQHAIFYPDTVRQLDMSIDGLLRSYLVAEQFEPKLGATFVLHTRGILSCTRVIVVGCGDMGALTSSDVQVAIASAAVRAKKGKAKRLIIAIPDELLSRFHAFLVGRMVTEGVAFGTYAFNKYKKNHSSDDIASVTVHLSQQREMRACSNGITDGVSRAAGVFLARDLVNEPSSVMTPSALAKEAKNIAAASSHIRCTIMGKKEIAALSMGAFLGVSKGSDEEPKFIKLVYRGGGKKTVCLVGKGITYDSGGLSLKPQSGLETMKCDMAGAAAILGVFATLAKTNPRITVVGLIAACENMPSGSATKPGDVVRAMNGKTIEIVNTDAEGRLILADALSYAEKFTKSDYTVDIATLTGACVVALGEAIAGVFSSDDALVHTLCSASQIAGETFWQLPMPKEYEEDLKSPIADISNVSKTKYGGAITAALFLKEFVSETTKWAHMDIAGPAFAEKETAFTRYGGTGFSVRTLLTFLEQIAEN